MTAGKRAEAHAALAALTRRGGRLRLDGDRVLVEWRGSRDEALAARLRAAKPELSEMLRPLPDALATVTEMFGGTVIEVEPNQPTVEEILPLPLRLAGCDRVLEKRDARGRVNFTGSEIESLRIGLASFAGQPGADARLERLHAAKKLALTAAVIARRIKAGSRLRTWQLTGAASR